MQTSKETSTRFSPFHQGKGLGVRFWRDHASTPFRKKDAGAERFAAFPAAERAKMATAGGVARWLISVVATAMLFAGCAYTLVSRGRVNQKQSEKIEAGIQDVRQLRFKHPVPLVVKSKDQAGAMIEADLMRDYTDNRLQVDGVAGALTGLYPTGIDLKAQTLK
jgi:hypothetical protein